MKILENINEVLDKWVANLTQMDSLFSGIGLIWCLYVLYRAYEAYKLSKELRKNGD